MTYDNIISHKKPGLHPNFWKNHREGGQINPLPPPSFLRVKTWQNKNNENKTHQTFTLRKLFESVLERKLVTKNAFNIASLCKFFTSNWYIIIDTPEEVVCICSLE